MARRTNERPMFNIAPACMNTEANSMRHSTTHTRTMIDHQGQYALIEVTPAEDIQQSHSTYELIIRGHTALRLRQVSHTRGPSNSPPSPTPTTTETDLWETPTPTPTPPIQSWNHSQSPDDHTHPRDRDRGSDTDSVTDTHPNGDTDTDPETPPTDTHTEPVTALDPTSLTFDSSRAVDDIGVKLLRASHIIIPLEAIQFAETVTDTRYLESRQIANPLNDTPTPSYDNSITYPSQPAVPK